MPGSFVVTAKTSLINRLKAAPDLRGVQVSYAWPGRRLERESIFGTKIRWNDELFAFSNPSTGRMSRLETATITLVVVVQDIGSDFAAADARAVELGTVLEELLAGNPTLDGGALATDISTGELEPLMDDDAAYSQLTYEISVRSELT